MPKKKYRRIPEHGYRYDELKEDVQTAVVAEFVERNYKYGIEEHDMSLEYYSGFVKATGFDCDNLIYSIGHQGEYAGFVGELDVEELWKFQSGQTTHEFGSDLDKIKCCSDSELYDLEKFWKFGLCNDVTWQSVKGRSYYGSCIIDMDDRYYGESKEIGEFIAQVNSIIEPIHAEICSFIFQGLRKEFDYFYSEERAVTELKEMDYEFEEDGEPW